MSARFAGNAVALDAVGHEALTREYELTPKPGLVDRRNTGAHRDMKKTMPIGSKQKGADTRCRTRCSASRRSQF